MPFLLVRVGLIILLYFCHVNILKSSAKESRTDQAESLFAGFKSANPIIGV